jgi:hypothetical protein
MEAPGSKEWFLRKHEDGSVFGPVPFQQLTHWASAAQIAPHDALSTDQLAWMKAPMLPQLGMDWLVEVTSERYYGPTTLGAIQEFIRLGEIDGDTFIVNSCDGTRKPIREMSILLQTRSPEDQRQVEVSEERVPAPAASGISVDLHDRIRELEQSLQEERRALLETEARYRDLENQYRELVQSQSAAREVIP